MFNGNTLCIHAPRLCNAGSGPARTTCALQDQIKSHMGAYVRFLQFSDRFWESYNGALQVRFRIGGVSPRGESLALPVICIVECRAAGWMMLALLVFCVDVVSILWDVLRDRYCSVELL